MMCLINYKDLKKVKSLLPYNPAYYTFDDMFSKYKRKQKKLGLATEEYFSLDYDSLLSELKQSIWIVINKQDLQYLNEKIKILEICYY